MVELKDCQQQEMEGELQLHSCLTLRTFWFLTVFNSMYPLAKMIL